LNPLTLAYSKRFIFQHSIMSYRHSRFGTIESAHPGRTDSPVIQRFESALSSSADMTPPIAAIKTLVELVMDSSGRIE
jgi:hypothetical protein